MTSTAASVGRACCAGSTCRWRRGRRSSSRAPTAPGRRRCCAWSPPCCVPRPGRGTVDGLSLTREAEAIRERITFVSARGYLYDDLTAGENLRFAGRLAGTPVATADVAALLAAAGLEHAAERPVRTYSTGMRRRLSLIGLRLRPVRLALVDEPYSGLDAEGVELADRLIADLLADGTTVFMASHQSGEATRRADRTLRLVDGRLDDGRRVEGTRVDASTAGPAS